ncbi:MAG: glycine zipper 2TM domain-containing protein [Janthinobacterium lividum]
MNSPSTNRRIHPLVATAAGAIILACVVAIAAMAGLFSKAGSSNAINGQTQQAPVDSAAASMPVVPNQAPPAQQAQTAPPPPAYVPPAPAAPAAPVIAQQTAPAYVAPPPMAQVCQSCGVVESVVVYRQEGHGTGIGAVGGAVAGGLVGNQFGGGGGRTAMTLLGAVGGGLAGNSVERHLRSETTYSVRVRLETGHYRTFSFRNPPPFARGQRVRIEHGGLAAA